MRKIIYLLLLLWIPAAGAGGRQDGQKSEKGADLSRTRDLITAEFSRLQSQPGYKTCTVYPDVDPA